MDDLVKIIRFPVAVIASIIVIGFWVVLFPIELVLVIITFPIAAILLTRNAVHNIYGGFPSSVRNIPTNLRTIWDWTTAEDRGVVDSCGCLIVIGILILVAIYIASIRR